ncbi:MAG: hypothetical protein ACOH2A_05420 [Sphingobacteriaceae bacterium]
MKKIYLLLFTFSCLCFSLVTQAQQQIKSTAEPDSLIKQSAKENVRAQNVFVELLGQGLLFTANYDTRFSNRRDGLGGRVGIGYMSIDNAHATMIPASLNYLLGNGGKHFFEIGLGATLLLTSGDADSFIFDSNEGNIVGTMSFSYRLQPVDSGFSLRAGLTPIFNADFFIPYFAGLSLGYTF